MSEYLYRGLRSEENKQKLLIPKASGSFAQKALTPIKTPFITGKNLDNAIRSQQKWCHNHPPTSGVSTTTSFKAAVGYATKRGVKNGSVAFINRKMLAQHGIHEAETSQNYECLFPEDKEIILFDNIGEPMPKEIIEQIVDVQSTAWSQALND